MYAKLAIMQPLQVPCLRDIQHVQQGGELATLHNRIKCWIGDNKIFSFYSNKIFITCTCSGKVLNCVNDLCVLSSLLEKNI